MSDPDPDSPERDKVMKADVDDADAVLPTSEQPLRISSDQLCEVVKVGLELSGATPLRSHAQPIAASEPIGSTPERAAVPDGIKRLQPRAAPSRSKHNAGPFSFEQRLDDVLDAAHRMIRARPFIGARLYSPLYAFCSRRFQ